MRTVTVTDGYNGETIELDLDGVVRKDSSCTLLRVVGRPHLARWIHNSDLNDRVICLLYEAPSATYIGWNEADDISSLLVEPATVYRPVVDPDDLRPLLAESSNDVRPFGWSVVGG